MGVRGFAVSVGETSNEGELARVLGGNGVRRDRAGVSSPE